MIRCRGLLCIVAALRVCLRRNFKHITQSGCGEMPSDMAPNTDGRVQTDAIRP